MAGHNKWSKVKRLKGALDAKRGRIFSRFAKEISLAARTGGGDISTNARLRTAVLAAREQNMPGDTIDRAIKKGTGEIAGQIFEEIVYEGYAPGGVAILLEAATDNKNRTAADLRSIFSKNHGNLATSGSVAYLFQRKGRITLPLASVTEDRLLEIAVESGADELAADDTHHIILTPPDKLYQIGESLKQSGLAPDVIHLIFQPATVISVDDEHVAAQVLRLCEALEDCDDIQNLHANFDIPDSVLEKLNS